jgi:flagellar export protein FliJ
MAFKFNLQRVLEMRKESADEAGRRLEEANAALERGRLLLREELDAYFSEREVFNDASREGRFPVLPGIERALEARKRRLLEIMTTLKELESDARIAEQALVLARRDLKAVENLREKRHDEWVHKEETKERKLLDELAIMRHARKA